MERKDLQGLLFYVGVPLALLGAWSLSYVGAELLENSNYQPLEDRDRPVDSSDNCEEPIKLEYLESGRFRVGIDGETYEVDPAKDPLLGIGNNNCPIRPIEGDIPFF